MESKINLTIKRCGSVLVSEMVNESLTLERAYSSYSELVDKTTADMKEVLMCQLGEIVKENNYDSTFIISTNFCIEPSNKEESKIPRQQIKSLHEYNSALLEINNFFDSFYGKDKNEHGTAIMWMCTDLSRIISNKVKDLDNKQ